DTGRVSFLRLQFQFSGGGWGSHAVLPIAGPISLLFFYAACRAMPRPSARAAIALYGSQATSNGQNERIGHPMAPRARGVPRPLTVLDPETAKLIEDVTIDSKGRAVPKLYSKLQANKELRQMLKSGKPAMS